MAITPQALLPDLTPWANQSKGFMYGWTIVGNDLRLTTAMANIGTGPMELRGGATHLADLSQDVYQRVYEPNGSYTDVLAGTFTYHPEHGHIHFDDFAQFRLRQVLPGGGVGDIVAAGDKVSFCLLDVERYNTNGPSSPQYLNCGQIQGISVGWADVYTKGLEGQSIEITNVPDGNYWLEVVVDPDNHIIESNENNNVARIQIALTRPVGNNPIPPDAFEPNNSFDTASILAPPEDHVYENLNIHASVNDDYYRVTASATGMMSFRLAFQNSQGDIDMEVFNSARTRIGVSNGNSNTEQVSFNAVAGQFYYVRVFGYNGATNPNYTFTVDQPEGISGGAPDQFEENDTFATARTLTPVSQTYTDLNVNTSGDDDYYRIVPTASGTMVVSLAFVHANGDLDMSILNASQARIGISESTTNAEQISVAVTAGVAYTIRVYGYQGATNPNYSMTINVPGAGPGIQPDSFEQNDTAATASNLPAVSQTYNNLTIDLANDDDFYKIVPTASGTLSVSLAFLNSQGNINLQILDAALAALGTSATTANSEQLSVSVTAGQTYYARVYGFQGAVNPNYSMTVTVPAGPGIPPDIYEQNDTAATASSLPAASQTYNNLTIDAANDDDYYKIVPTASGTLSVSLAFQNAQGNVDLQILNSSLGVLGTSATTGNSESLNVAVTAGQTYYVRVYGFQGALSPLYSMTVTVPAAPGIPPDSFEDNDTFATARTLAAVDQTYPNLTIDAAGDNDYYKFTATVSGTATVSLAFTHSQGDIDLQILNASQAQIGKSESVTNSEQVSFAVTAGTTYYIRVYGYQNAVNPNYTMTIDVPNPPPPFTAYLSTAESGTLTSTDGSPSLSFADSDILKLTVQSNGQYGYQLQFDGSDVGLTTADEDIDAFCFLPDGSIVLSTVGAFSVPGPGGTTITGGGEDLLRFVPTSLGPTTAGTWSMYFDGSDVGLSGTAENIDAVAVLSNGKILISTTGSFSVPGASGEDEDLIVFTPTSLGANTAGTWALYFDGSDVGLSTNDNEDVNALDVRETSGNPTLYFSTLGAFSVTGVSGANEDVFAFTPTTLGATTAGTFGPGLAFVGSLYGLAAYNVDGFHFVPAGSGLQALTQTTTTSSPVVTGANLLSSAATVTTSQAATSKKSVPTSPSTSSASSAANTVLLAAVTTTSTTKSSSTGGSSTSTAKAPATSSKNSGAGLTVWDHIADSLDQILPKVRK